MILSLLTGFRFLVNWRKSKLDPSQLRTWLGLLVDSRLASLFPSSTGFSSAAALPPAGVEVGLGDSAAASLVVREPELCLHSFLLSIVWLYGTLLFPS